MQTWPGTAYPLGATFDGNGTNFALFSEAADRVELCLFEEAADGSREETRVELIEVDAFAIEIGYGLLKNLEGSRRVLCPHCFWITGLALALRRATCPEPVA